MDLGLINFGVDIGREKDHSAIVLSRPEIRGGEVHFIVHGMKSLPLLTSFEEIEKTVIEAWNTKAIPEGYSRNLWIDAIGVGAPIAERLRKVIGRVHSVTVTGGERVEKLDVWQKQFSIPKAQMVANLQFLFGYRRIHLVPGDKISEEMKQELMDFDLKVTSSQNVQYGAFRVGTHDDLVTALGLACLGERQRVPMAFSLSGGIARSSGGESTRPEIARMLQDQRRLGIADKPWDSYDYIERWTDPNKKF